MRSPLMILACSLALAGPPARAAVEKNAVAGADGIVMSWWPRLPEVPGWRQDPVASLQYGASALVPAGADAGPVDAVLYGKAQYKPRAADVHSLEELIARDRRDFAESGDPVHVKDSAGLRSGDGRPLACLQVEPQEQGRWLRVCYLEEGDYYLMFALSARSAAAFHGSMKGFETLVARYHE